MLAAKALTINCGDTPECWRLKSLPESRFPKVVELLHVCRFEIHGAINKNDLSPNTQYASYLVFKMIDADGFHCRPLNLTIDIVGAQSSTKNVCFEERHLHTNLQRWQYHRLVRSSLSSRMSELETKGDIVNGQTSTKNVCLDLNLKERQLHNRLRGLQFPNVRSDGWLEIEMGEFFNSDLEDDKVHMGVMETSDLKWKSGLFIEGIEVRPKEGN